MRTVIEAHGLLPEGLSLESLSIEGGRVVISVSSRTSRSRCPVCGRGSSRVHSRYSRAVSDLPWHGISVELAVRARRFFCDEASCERSIFCERMPDIAARARKTARMEEALLAIVFELGGRAGARLAAELGLLVGRDALLVRAKSAPLPNVGKVRALGVDDFAFKKGNAYGTILVDLERRRVVDLLRERSTESVASWLREHPGVEVATRDRSHVYRQGISEGAPGAVQVADRWHLLHNLSLVLEDFLLQKQPALRKAAAPEEGAGADLGFDADVSAPGSLTPTARGSGTPARRKRPRSATSASSTQWKEIRRLYLAGMDLREIRRELGVSVRTVYRYKDLTGPPPRRRHKRRASVLDPYVPYLVQRWNEGCHNGERLYREILEQGYSHSHTNVTRLLSEFRRATVAGRPLSVVPTCEEGRSGGAFTSAKNVAALFMRRKRSSRRSRQRTSKAAALDPAVEDAHRSPRSSLGWSATSKERSWTGGSKKPRPPRRR